MCSSRNGSRRSMQAASSMQMPAPMQPAAMVAPGSMPAETPASMRSPTSHRGARRTTPQAAKRARGRQLVFASTSMPVWSRLSSSLVARGAGFAIYRYPAHLPPVRVTWSRGPAAFRALFAAATTIVRRRGTSSGRSAKTTSGLSRAKLVHPSTLATSSSAPLRASRHEDSVIEVPRHAAVAVVVHVGGERIDVGRIKAGFCKRRHGNPELFPFETDGAARHAVEGRRHLVGVVEPDVETTDHVVGAHPDHEVGRRARVDGFGWAVVAEAPPIVAPVLAGVPLECDLEAGRPGVGIVRDLGDHVGARGSTRIGPGGAAGERDFAGLSAVEKLAAGSIGGNAGIAAAPRSGVATCSATAARGAAPGTAAAHPGAATTGAQCAAG